MKDLFKKNQAKYQEYTVFQDESKCKNSNFFYHGFLFVDNECGRNMLDDLINIKIEENERWAEIHFSRIKKSSQRSRIAMKWIELARKWLKDGKIRFYFFGIDKKTLRIFGIMGGILPKIFILNHLRLPLIAQLLGLEVTTDYLGL